VGQLHQLLQAEHATFVDSQFAIHGKPVSAAAHADLHRAGRRDHAHELSARPVDGRHGFGIALGRLARSNSSQVWTAPEALAHDIVEVATSAQGITLTLVSALLLASAFAFAARARRYGQGRNTRRRMSMERSSTAPRSVDDSADT